VRRSTGSGRICRPPVVMKSRQLSHRGVAEILTNRTQRPHTDIAIAQRRSANHSPRKYSPATAGHFPRCVGPHVERRMILETRGPRMNGTRRWSRMWAPFAESISPGPPRCRSCPESDPYVHPTTSTSLDNPVSSAVGRAGPQD
jgi:hypothetical protein